MRNLSVAALLLALEVAPLAGQAPALPGIVREGLEAFKSQGYSAALAIWLKGSPVEGQAQSGSGALREVHSAYGEVVGYDVLKVVAVGEYVTRSYVVVRLQRGPLYAWFDCYKVDDRWIIPGFLFNTKPDVILPPGMLAPP